MLKLTSIRVGYIVSYDYEYLLTSIKLIYSYVDKIVLAMDANRQTWSGNKFEIPTSFFDLIKAYDKKNIIEFYFEDFYVPTLTPMECETRERNLLLKRLGKSGWKIQLDVDEYIYDFKSVKKFLNRNWFFNVFPKLTPMQFRGNLVTLYKEIQGGFLFIDNKERFSFITNCNQNSTARITFGVSSHYTNINVIHQSWARKENEIQTKIKNWGHRDDFDTTKYYNFWNSLSSENYNEYINIHPMSPKLWDKLYFLESNNIDDFVNKYSELNKQKIIQINFLFLMNKIKAKIFK